MFMHAFKRLLWIEYDINSPQVCVMNVWSPAGSKILRCHGNFGTWGTSGEIISIGTCIEGYTGVPDH